ncbi:hypothetical protein ACT3UQ_08955 [Glutamicibacter sp. AOP12-B1-11]|uniref:hypothetical protein n=1 Tax=Glutamicibacter sp. AOP12-B1-11 TaxID=3457725 RepID=UPI0040340FD3
MSANLPGNPHVFAGPQIASPVTINEDFIAQNGITEDTVILSELTRNTESNLAVAYEIRTQTLVQMLASNNQAAVRIYGADLHDAPAGLIEMLREQGEELSDRLGRD